MPYLYLFLAIICNAVANICLKLGAAQFDRGISNLIKDPLIFLKNGYVMIGIIFFAVALVLYTLVLARMNLSVAYPMMVSIGFVIVLSYSVFFLHEQLVWWQWLGIALVASGVILLSITEA